MQKLTHTLCLTAFSMLALPVYSADSESLRLPVDVTAKAASNSTLLSADRTARIYGGTVVPDSKYPWMVAVNFQGDQGCGGTLIADRWVLTNAHCMFYSPGELEYVEDISVVLGATNLDSTDGITKAATQFIVHPDYDPDTRANDIALIQLEYSISIEPISLPSVSSVPLVGEMGAIAGWGLISEGVDSSELREVDLPIVSHSACYAWYHLEDWTLNETLQFCAGGYIEGGKDACNGDSGGPLFVEREGEYVQAGITSGGIGCGLEGTPGTYTRVSNYFDWITSHMIPASVYDGESENIEVAVEDMPVVLDSNINITGSLAAGGTKSFLVQGTDLVTLESVSGDADLYVFNSASYSDESLVCFSYEIGEIDECQLDTVDDYWVFLITYEASDYALTVSGESDGPVPSGEPPVVDEVEIVTLTVDESVESSLLESTGEVFRATSGNQAILTSISGDADLLIYSSETFNAVTLLCSSTESGSAIDMCSYDAGDSEVFILVNGNEATDYSLTIIDSELSSEEELPIDPTDEVTPDEDPSDIVLASGTGSFSGIFALLGLLTGATLRRRAFRQVR